MSLVDPSAGRAFVWFVFFSLFLCILSGGACLLVYIILPETESTAWLPVAGLSLVCLPWFFWILTFFYRVISRACGFRVSLAMATSANDTNDDDNNNNNSSGESPRCDARAQAEEDGNNDDQRRSNLSSNNSIMSRESEIPFAISMGS
ncbi:hypothetical protein SDJN02_27912, partial [Cucurbita argyrosperma subsp. argyrosperma]